MLAVLRLADWVSNAQPQRCLPTQAADVCKHACMGRSFSARSTHAALLATCSINPYGEHYYDGVSLNPLEVMFVKTKGVLLGNDWSYSLLAAKYDEWLAQQVSICRW